jgi:hypothetical protein
MYDRVKVLYFFVAEVNIVIRTTANFDEVSGVSENADWPEEDVFVWKLVKFG